MTNRIFVSYVEYSEENRVTLDFVTVRDKELNDPSNRGVSVESIVMVNGMGYDTVDEFLEDYVEEYNEDAVPEEMTVEEIEDAISEVYEECDYVYRTYKEYIAPEN